MTILRSREVVPVIQKEHSHTSAVEIQPLTPAKEVERTNKSSHETTPSFLQTSHKPDSTDSGSISNQGLRRSARLSSKSTSYNVGLTKKRKVVDLQTGKVPSPINSLSLFDVDGNEKVCGASRSRVRNVGVSSDLDTADDCEANSILVSDLGADQYDEEEIQSVRKLKSPSLSSVDAQVQGSESVQEDDAGKGCLKLRSGKKLLKPGVKHVAHDEKLSALKDKKETKKIESEAVVDRVNQGSSTIEAKRGSRGNRNGSEKARKRFSREEKKKGVLVDIDDNEESGLEKKIKIRVDEESETISKTTVGEEMYIDLRNDVNDATKRDRSGLHLKEKGKGKVVEVDPSANCSDMVDSHMESKVASLMDSTIAETVSMEQAAIERAATSTSPRRDHMERFKNIARRNASRFAYFSAQEEEEEEDPLVDEVELELPQMEANGDVEDWPGPFSTAMKIIKDRAANIPAQQKTLTSDKSHIVPLIWVPKEKQQHDRRKEVAPSLQELCMAIIAENVDAIISLENVPDVLRHKLTHLLCDSRKMNNHFFDLLASGSPSEIRIKDCSWLNEEKFTKTFERNDTSNLTVLQLDQCGRCLPDYVLFTTLAHLPSKFSALTIISLKGACRLSDAGLSALVSSAPALRSINLGCCSLLTSVGIIDLADKLGPVLKELYIDECFGIDAIRILPALLKLECLEVLSISRFETVNDSFIRQFVAVRGEKMKEFVLADCTKLTDKSLKAIAKSCPGLCAIDLTNLSKLTDTAIGHLANGCQTIQTMKFCRNAFSDEAVAAYIEACGKPLKELSLNHVDEVGNHTALSLAKHARNLLSLDLSWCRNMTNEALGLIVDSCASLKMVKLFGCTQMTNVFLDGHSNEEVRITGLKGSQILKNTQVHDHSFPLRYSSI
ncbi:hypothetical protein L6452_26400 [Arctium lappa]|uniref:Uncharacterized protein n=1 Tax=Arctium lappa TaxID=4217 RepID=A0ACB8ZV61_ARCLA|nr:hypothetical protein L6452_26400 [Arctium lappa]